MDIKEVVRSIFNTFFIIFTCSIIGMVIFFRLLGLDFAPLRDIVGIFVTVIFTSLAEIVLYSKRELKRLELFVRHVVHLLAIMGISLAVASYMRWILWSVPITVIRFTGLIAGIYIAVIAILFFESKKLADKLNEKLKERYKG